jgi:copper(I)-binding protein
MIKKSVILSYVFLSLIVLIMSACTSGDKPEIVVKDVTVVQSGMMKGVASSFMQIINNGSGSDRLTECIIKEYPSARGELHDFKDGRMTKVEEVIIPAHETTELMRGSIHIMFFKIPEKLKGEVTLIMNFEKSGPIEVSTATALHK